LLDTVGKETVKFIKHMKQTAVSINTAGIKLRMKINSINTFRDTYEICRSEEVAPLV